MITLKMADKGRSDFNVVLAMSLFALELKQNLISLPFSSRSALKLGIQAPESYLKLPCEYELHSVPDTEVNAARDYGENYIKV